MSPLPLSATSLSDLPATLQPVVLGTGPATIASAALFAGQREVHILHQGEQYRLRITRQDKLILTK